MKWIIPLIALSLSGCAFGKDEAPGINVAVVEPSSVRLPAECTAKDKPWVDVAASDIPRSAAVKNYNTNKDQYNRILTRRSVCRAAITAAQKG